MPPRPPPIPLPSLAGYTPNATVPVRMDKSRTVGRSSPATDRRASGSSSPRCGWSCAPPGKSRWHGLTGGHCHREGPPISSPRVWTHISPQPGGRARPGGWSSGTPKSAATGVLQDPPCAPLARVRARHPRPAGGVGWTCRQHRLRSPGRHLPGRAYRGSSRPRGPPRPREQSWLGHLGPGSAP